MPFIINSRVVNPNSLSHYTRMKDQQIPYIVAMNQYPNGTYYIRDSGKKAFEGYHAEDIGLFVLESENVWIGLVTGKAIEEFSYAQLEKLLECKREIDSIIKEVNEGEKK